MRPTDEVLGTHTMLDGGGLNITVISYRDHVDFGFVVCPEIVKDPWLLADATSGALVELQKAAADLGPSTP